MVYELYGLTEDEIKIVEMPNAGFALKGNITNKQFDSAKCKNWIE